MAMKEQVMYLRVGASDQAIRKAISDLVGADESLGDQFGRFRTETIPTSPSLKARKPKARSHYVRLTITASEKAYATLYTKLGAVPLGD